MYFKMSAQCSIRVNCCERSEPIKIPIKTKVADDKDTNDYCDPFQMGAIIFDPSKASPPNHWNDRLLKRIAKFHQEPLKNLDTEK